MEGGEDCVTNYSAVHSHEQKKKKTRTIDEVVLPFYSKRCTQEEEEEESQQPNSRTFWIETKKKKTNNFVWGSSYSIHKEEEKRNARERRDYNTRTIQIELNIKIGKM
jgi:hypothetical protein